MLSTTAEYALRAMIQLAQIERDTALLGRDLAERSGVPPNYLAKILVTLKNAGLVSAVRGFGGGYKLVRPPSEVHLVEVLELFDPARAHPRCILDVERACSDEDPCTAHEKWRSVRLGYIDFVITTTLEEVASMGKDRI